MPKVTDPTILTGLVDAFLDNNPKTMDSSPGKIDGHQLRLVAQQIERRFLRKASIKNWIYVAEGTRELFYKPTPNSPAWVRMGVSLSRLKAGFSPRDEYAIPMEQYANYFLDQSDHKWLKQNDFVLA